MLAMDWRKVRKALQDLRIERKMGVPELAEEAAVAKTTVYRLEDLTDDPDRGPDLETIEKLTTAMGLSLGAFFGRIEGGGPSLSLGGSNVAHTEQGDPIHAERAALREIDTLKSRIERLETALGATEDVAKRLGELAAARAKGAKTPSGKTGRSRRARKVG